jgi:DNA-binding HxlR family transcriptional regulator
LTKDRQDPELSSTKKIDFPPADLLTKRFEEFSEQAWKFCREVSSSSNDILEQDPERNAQINLTLTRTIFAKWNIDILVMLYGFSSLGFEDIRKGLKVISAKVLSQKLRLLEKHGLVKRTVLDLRPPRVRYSLTKRGLTMARLGEPVILYLRLKEGLLLSNIKEKTS